MFSFNASLNTNTPESILKEPQTSSLTPLSRKLPPVNVVTITSSDTLPTTTPPAQPNFSVTIPAEHRLGVTQNTSGTSFHINTPHGYQISMPSTPNIPTTVNLPPLSATMTVSSPIAKTNREYKTFFSQLVKHGKAKSY